MNNQKPQRRKQGDDANLRYKETEIEINGGEKTPVGISFSQYLQTENCDWNIFCVVSFYSITNE